LSFDRAFAILLLVKTWRETLHEEKIKAMTYNHQTGVKNRSKRLGLLGILPIIGVIGGVYMLANTFAPSLPSDATGETARVLQKLTKRQPALKENRLYVPKLGIDVAIVEGVTESTLEGGAWHRKPQNGDPIAGGNFVLAAHRFNLGLTPQQTRAKSPFYHINQLEKGDEVFVDFKGVRYAYKVDSRYKVNSEDVEIEDRTTDARMTMYSCDLRGPKAGREVVEALPVGTVAWVEGAPKLKTTQ